MGVNDKQNRAIRRERKRLFRRRERNVLKADLQATLQGRNLEVAKDAGPLGDRWERIKIWKCDSQESHRRRTTRQKNPGPKLPEEYLPELE